MSFERLLKSRSIAVFGGAQAQEVIRQGDRMRFKGEIWPVHPKKTEVEGRPVYRSVEDLPGSSDAAYIDVNRYLAILPSETSLTGMREGRSARWKMTIARQIWKYAMARLWELKRPARSPSPAGTASSRAPSRRVFPAEL